MPYLNFNSASSALKLVISLMSIITIGLIVWFMGFLLFRMFFSIDVPEANTLLHGGTVVKSLTQIRFILLIQTLGFFVLPGIFLQWLFSTPKESYFEIRKPANKYSRLFVFLILLVSIPLINYLIEYNRNIQFPEFLKNLETSLMELEQSAQSLTNEVLSVNTVGGFLVNILIIAIIPAIGEEFIFRGVFQRVFTDLSKNKHMAIVLTAILFSAVHGQFYGFVPRFVMGLFFGYLMIWSGTIWLPVIAHFINNAIAVSIYYFGSSGIIDINPDKLQGGIFQTGGVILSAVLCVIGVILLKRYETKKLSIS